MEGNEQIIIIIERIALLVTTCFTIYKLLFEKKKNDVALDSSKIKLLNDIIEAKESRIRGFLDEYKELTASEIDQKRLIAECQNNNLMLQAIVDEQKVTINEQKNTIRRQNASNRYYIKLLEEHKIPYDTSED